MTESKIAREWYWASAIFSGVHAPNDGWPCLKERKVFLLKASHEEEAFSFAKTIAEAKQHSYLSANNSHINWVFQYIESVQLILDEMLIEGTEVFWQYFE